MSKYPRIATVGYNPIRSSTLCLNDETEFPSFAADPSVRINKNIPNTLHYLATYIANGIVHLLVYLTQRLHVYRLNI